VTDSVLGAGAAVEAGAAVSGVSIVGPGAVVPAGERLTGARVEAPGSPGYAP
jgi:carbonic anhydrase/acetyltransferase-like protein (isoleucine patch superfamily)